MKPWNRDQKQLADRIQRAYIRAARQAREEMLFSLKKKETKTETSLTSFPADSLRKHAHAVFLLSNIHDAYTLGEIAPETDVPDNFKYTNDAMPVFTIPTGWVSRSSFYSSLKDARGIKSGFEGTRSLGEELQHKAISWLIKTGEIKANGESTYYSLSVEPGIMSQLLYYLYSQVAAIALETTATPQLIYKVLRFNRFLDELAHITALAYFNEAGSELNGFSFLQTHYGRQLLSATINSMEQHSIAIICNETLDKMGILHRTLFEMLATVPYVGVERPNFYMDESTASKRLLSRLNDLIYNGKDRFTSQTGEFLKLLGQCQYLEDNDVQDALYSQLKEKMNVLRQQLELFTSPTHYMESYDQLLTDESIHIAFRQGTEGQYNEQSLLALYMTLMANLLRFRMSIRTIEKLYSFNLRNDIIDLFGDWECSLALLQKMITILENLQEIIPKFAKGLEYNESLQTDPITRTQVEGFVDQLNDLQGQISKLLADMAILSCEMEQLPRMMKWEGTNRYQENLARIMKAMVFADNSTPYTEPVTDAEVDRVLVWTNRSQVSPEAAVRVHPTVTVRLNRGAVSSVLSFSGERGIARVAPVLQPAVTVQPAQDLASSSSRDNSVFKSLFGRFSSS